MSPIFDHAALHVHDLEKSAEFYEQVVGLDRIPDPFHDGKHVWLGVGANVQLHLIADAMDGPARDIGVHLAFRVPSVSAFAAHLYQIYVSYCGGAHLGQQTIGVRPDGVNQIYFEDPDGYWIEVNDAKY